MHEKKSWVTVQKSVGGDRRRQLGVLLPLPCIFGVISSRFDGSIRGKPLAQTADWPCSYLIREYARISDSSSVES